MQPHLDHQTIQTLSASPQEHAADPSPHSKPPHLMNSTNTETTAAPSAAISTALGKIISPERIATALSDALSSTTIARNGVVEADTRSRLQAASLILAYLVGRPVERSENVSIIADADSRVEISERLRRSPALRAQLARSLAEAGGGDIDV
jgi:hypothetical protein